MDLVVKKMAKITVSKDLLKQIDMPALIKSFKNDYDQLDNLKVARKKHEERNWVSRWWNSDELEDAQLDAAELQASFSKKLGQLMVISIEQSKLLTQQQDNLQLQQNKIKQQATELASANVQLDQQQHKQMNQQRELEKLINDYFELKGLTTKDAEKLILIANEVKEIKSTIFAKLEHEFSAISQIKDSLFERFEQEVQVFDGKLEQFEVELQSQLKKISIEFSEKFTETQQTFDESFKNINTIMAQNYETLSQASEITNSTLTQLEIDSQAKHQELNEELIAQQNTLEQTNSNLAQLEIDSQAKHQELNEELTAQQSALEQTNSNLAQLEIDSQTKYQELNKELTAQQTALEQTNSNLVMLEDDVKDQQKKLERELTTQQISIEKTNSTLTGLESVTESQHQDLKSNLLDYQSDITNKIEQLDLQYKQKFTEQESLISSEQKQQQEALAHKNKQVKNLTIGLVTSLLLGTASLVIIIYPYLMPFLHSNN